MQGTDNEHYYLDYYYYLDDKNFKRNNSFF